MTLPAGWPLTAMLVGYPVWWLLGVADVVPLIAAAIMAVQLVKMPRVTVRPGFGWWLLFLAWVAIGVLLLQVDAPDAVPDHSSSRYVTFAFRLGWYLAATTTLVYIYNMRARLSSTRILRAFSWLFVGVVVGGVLGTIAPTIDFPSLVELLLPHRITHIQYVHDLVHPVMAQRYSVNGVVHPRASAPFAYTNDWGLNYACLLPFFVLGWLRHDAGWRRKVGPVVLLVSIYPVVMTQNRGMWVALVISAAVISVRAGLHGRAKPLLGLAAVVAVVAAILLVTPLGHTISNRLANGYSNSGRSSLGQLTVESVVQKAPVIGLGSTRNVQGSFYSIAGGDTATCSLCSPPALGTQGHFWLVVFSTGLGGLALYLGFIGSQLLRSARRYSATATLALSVLTTHLATMFVYDTIGIALVTIFAAIGLLWRDSVEVAVGRRPTGDPRDRNVGAYAALLLSNATVVIVCVCLGTAAGLALDHTRPHPYSAETTLAIPRQQVYPGMDRYTLSLDMIADLIDAPQVKKAVAAAGGAGSARLSVTATPNSRVLHVQAADAAPARAVRISIAAARALDQLRIALVKQALAQAATTLEYRQQVLAESVDGIDALPSSGTSPGSMLAATRDDLENQLVSNAISIGQITADPVLPSAISVNPTVLTASGAGIVAACSGAALGLLLAVLIAFLRDAVGGWVGRRRATQTVAGLWVVNRLPQGVNWANGATPSRSGDVEAERTLDLLASIGASLVVSSDHDAATRAASAYLNSALVTAECDTHASISRVVLLAGPRTRLRHLADLRDDLERRGASVCGLVLGEQLVGSTRAVHRD